jgi:hypothetical protein
MLFMAASLDGQIASDFSKKLKPPFGMIYS